MIKNPNNNHGKNSNDHQKSKFFEIPLTLTEGIVFAIGYIGGWAGAYVFYFCK